jgi:hypothetical protein
MNPLELFTVIQVAHQNANVCRTDHLTRAVAQYNAATRSRLLLNCMIRFLSNKLKVTLPVQKFLFFYGTFSHVHAKEA